MTNPSWKELSQSDQATLDDMYKEYRKIETAVNGIKAIIDKSYYIKSDILSLGALDDLLSDCKGQMQKRLNEYGINEDFEG